MTSEKREARALLGFMGEHDAVNFWRGTVVQSWKTQEEFVEIWRKATAAVDKLPKLDLSVHTTEIPERFSDQLKELAKDPLFQEATAGKSWSFKMVDMDNLVCFQKFVYTDHSEAMTADYNFSDMTKLIEFCLSEKPLKRRLEGMVGSNEFTLLAPSHDFRVLGMSQSQDPSTKRVTYGFTTGWGVPFVQVVQLNDRVFLKNGYHRAYALRKAGIKQMPCISIEGKDIADTGIGDLGFFDDKLTLSSKPPTLACYFSNEISPALEVKPLTKIVRIRAEESILPTMLPSLSPRPEDKQAITGTAAHGSHKHPQYDELKIIKEGWDTYLLDDGTTLKLRMILLKVKVRPQAGSPPMIGIEPSPLLMARFSPARLKGPGSEKQYTPEELANFIVARDIGHRVVERTTNEYLTGGLKLQFQIKSVSISRTNKYDREGDPWYIANAQSDVQVTEAQH